MEGPRSSKKLVIIFSKKEMYKILLVITIPPFSIYILAPTDLPFLEAPLVAVFCYDSVAFCHILLNFSYRVNTKAFEPNLKSQVQPVGDGWNWGLYQQPVGDGWNWGLYQQSVGDGWNWGLYQQPMGDVWNWGIHQKLLHCEGGIKSRRVMMHNTNVSSIFWPIQNALNQSEGDANFVYLFNNTTLI
jgi:hypothetical protein